MNTVVEKLWELQTTLSELAEREQRLNTKPEAFAAVDEEYQKANAEMEELQKKLETLAQERRRVEGELQDKQGLLKKYQGQLMQVKNQQQYAAAWKEIDVSRKEVKDLEEGVLRLMTEAEELQAALDARREGHQELQSRHDAQYQEWQSSLGELRDEIARIRNRAEAIEAAIPAAVRSEFHRIFKHRRGVAMARVEGGACSACRVRIRPVVNQQLQRGELVLCEGCRRFFYMETVAS